MSFFDDDDDFQIPLTRRTLSLSHKPPLPTPTRRPSKIPKISFTAAKKIAPLILSASRSDTGGSESPSDVVGCSLDSISLSFDSCPPAAEKEEILDRSRGFSGNSIESKLLMSGGDRSFFAGKEWSSDEDEGELDELLRLCSGLEDGDGGCGLSDTDGVVEDGNGCAIECPLCGVDISDLSEEQRHRHTNECIDREDDRTRESVVAPPCEEAEEPRVSRQSGDVPGVVEWLRDLGLAKYEDVFTREEIDCESLQWLTEEDLLNMGIIALGPRKKIVHAIFRLRKGSGCETEAHTKPFISKDHEKSTTNVAESPRISFDRQDDNSANKIATNKLITDFFPGYSGEKRKVCRSPIEQKSVIKKTANSNGKRYAARGKLKDPPSWCRIPGTQFRVDAFRYLRGDCLHWFLTHFHMDHYQGLTKSFCHGKIYCSSITAKLVNMKIGIPWERIHVLPLNQKVTIGSIDVTSLDANHCPGAIILLFEPPDGKAVLHTGDFRFSEDSDMISLLKTRLIHTLILDTTYCAPQYDFPKQEAVIQFVLDAVQAESFNPKTLFLIGSYTIGKERLFLEVARVLRKKIYVNAAKQRILNCLDLPQEDMRWFTQNEQESEIHVVPMWSIASFKRLQHVANHYKGRFSLIVAFTPTGWTFDKGKKATPGRKLRRGTIIRYEVPYSEHSSFTELKEFVKIVSPVNIIPSVNNHSSDSANSMVSLLVN